MRSLLPVNGLLSGDKVKPVSLNSKLPLDVLGRVSGSLTRALVLNLVGMPPRHLPRHRKALGHSAPSVFTGAAVDGVVTACGLVPGLHGAAHRGSPAAWGGDLKVLSAQG